jgi:hypothetical protein
MPEYGDGKANEAYRTIYVHFTNPDDVKNFAELTDEPITDKTRFIWYPYKEKRNMKDLQFVTENES